MTGPYAPAFWALFLTNVFIPQMLWSRKVRTNLGWLLFVSMSINIGMWLERFVIIVISLSRDHLPSSWGSYTPTRFDFFTFFGTVGLFFTLLFLFIRFLPLISIFEVRTLLPSAHAAEHEVEDEESHEEPLPAEPKREEPTSEDDASDADEPEEDDDEPEEDEKK
jgi:Ni/Fe-hydrogenase subunit HybB-like protein